MIVKQNKKVLAFLILIQVALYSCSNVDSLDESMADDSTDLTEEQTSEYVEELSDDEKLIKSIREEILKRDLGVEDEMKVSLSQAEFHPYESDILGDSRGASPIFRVSIKPEDENYKKLSLTFDSGDVDSTSYIYEILDLLDANDMKATFFMTYPYMKANPKHVIDVIERGHEVGNHSNKHGHFSKLSDEEIIEEVLVPHYFVKELTGVDMCLFRFPFGEYSDRAIELLKLLGYYPIQWSLDSIDWRGEAYDILYGRLVNSGKVYSGAITLFHVWPDNTPLVLPFFIEYLKENGYKSIKVSDLILKHQFNMDYGRQFKAE